MEAQSELFSTSAPVLKPWQTPGHLAKERGMALVAANESEEWTARADAAINDLAVSGVVFTAEQVREVAGDPSRPNAMGARLHAAARAGIIQKVGYTEADRKSRHRAIVAKWVGA